MIREANINDIEKINALGIDINNNFSNTYNIKKYLSDNKYIILVYDDIEIKGFLLVLKNIDDYEIEAIVVKKSERHKKIGTKLLNYFFDKYLKENDRILLEVAKSNEIAIKLYQKMGFNIINVRKKYYKGEDALIMEKVII